MLIKQLIVLAVKKIFNSLGYDVTFTQKFEEKGSQDYALVDKYMWEPYFSTNHMMQLYFEGLIQARIEWSDNFYKQLRFYSLQELVHYVIRRKLKGDFVECGAWKGQSADLTVVVLSIFLLRYGKRDTSSKEKSLEVIL